MNSNQAILLTFIFLYLLLCLISNIAKAQDCILEESIKINGTGFQEHQYQGVISYSNSSNITIFNLTRTKDIFEENFK